MRFDDLFDVLGGLVLVALATTIVTRGRGAAQVVDSMGEAFSRSIRAAIGR